jgi:dihydrofolate synthase/folylpolyglutamate synthase
LNTPARSPRAHFATLAEWLAWLETLHPKKIDLSLERIGIVLRALGLVPPPYTVITVGGTNGKGSCVALLERIYGAAGYRVGAFTSPHLWRFNERIRYGARDISDAALIDLFEIIDAVRGDVTLSYFETSAVAALLHFARAGAQVAVLEVGLGGRLDAVNAIDADAALIVSVDIDHVEWLGPDRDSIGAEKAGIARPGRPVIVADPEPPAGLLGSLANSGAIVRRVGRDYTAVPEPDGWRYAAPSERSERWPRPRFGTSEEQLGNAAACVAVVEALADVRPVRSMAIADGLRTAQLRGRFERHLRAGVEWIFDIAHNPAAAQVLADAVASAPPAARTLGIVGLMRDKDLPGVLRPLVGEVDRWFVTPVDSERSAEGATLAAVLASLGAMDVEHCATPAAACLRAQAGARAGERVLVFGSFYTVGPALEALGLYCEPSEPDD